MRFKVWAFLIGCCAGMFALVGCSAFPTSATDGLNPLSLTKHPFESTENREQSVSSVRFRMIFPEAGQGTPSKNTVTASVLGVPPKVAFNLSLVNNDNASQPTTTLSKTVEVNAAGTAETTFTNVPTVPAICSVQIQQGSIKGYSDFHGALDLKPGTDNEIVIAPKGSLIKEDVVATILENIVANTYLFSMSAPISATRVEAAIQGRDLNSGTMLSEVLSLIPSQPVIERVSSYSISTAVVVSIRGRNFGLVRSGNSLFYSGIEVFPAPDSEPLSMYRMRISSWSDNEIVVFVPFVSDNYTFFVPKTGTFVVSSGGILSPPSERLFFPPRVSSFNSYATWASHQSRPEMPLLISGFGFGNSQGNSSVNCGTYPVSIIFWSDMRIEVDVSNLKDASGVIPPGTYVPLTLTINGMSVQTGRVF